MMTGQVRLGTGRRLVGADIDYGHGHGGCTVRVARATDAARTQKRKTLRDVAWHGVAGVPSAAAPRPALEL